jgi:hypothetical protein
LPVTGYPIPATVSTNLGSCRHRRAQRILGKVVLIAAFRIDKGIRAPMRKPIFPRS